MAQRLDASGAVKSSDLYNAYGKRLSGGGASGDPYGFGGQAGYYTDSETGLSLLGQRFYDPSVSRFLNRDPIGYGGGMNLYRYADNNPVSEMDPSGLAPGDDEDPVDKDIRNFSGGPASRFAGGFNADGGMGQRVAAGSPERNDFSQFVRMVPVVGGIAAGYNALTGCDIVAGRKESAANRGWDGVMAALAFIPGGSAGGAARGSKITLYRAVSTAELQDILASGKFRAVAGQMETKWFATSAKDAATWGRDFYKKGWSGPFWIVSAKIDKSIIGDAANAHYDPYLDFIAPAYNVYAKNLKFFKGIKVLPHWPL